MATLGLILIVAVKSLYESISNIIGIFGFKTLILIVLDVEITDWIYTI